MIKCLLRRAIYKFERDWRHEAGCIRGLIDATPRAAWLFSQVTSLGAAALVVVVGLVTSAAAQTSIQSAVVSPYTLTPRRIGASLAVMVGLIGAVIGGVSLARAASRIGSANRRRGPIVAMVLGPIGLVTGALVVVTANGGLGTGNGLGGGVVAMLVGLIAITLGALALGRSRPTG